MPSRDQRKAVSAWKYFLSPQEAHLNSLFVTGFNIPGPPIKLWALASGPSGPVLSECIELYEPLQTLSLALFTSLHLSFLWPTWGCGCLNASTLVERKQSLGWTKSAVCFFWPKNLVFKNSIAETPLNQIAGNGAALLGGPDPMLDLPLIL